MSGFADFLIGAVAGGVEGVDERIKEDDKLAREMGLEEWRLQRKQAFDQAHAEFILKQKASPENLAAEEAISAANSAGSAKGANSAALTPDAERVREREALHQAKMARENKIAELEAQNDFFKTPAGKEIAKRESDQAYDNAYAASKGRAVAENDVLLSEDATRAAAKKVSDDVLAKLNATGDLIGGVESLMGKALTDDEKYSVLEATTGVNLLKTEINKAQLADAKAGGAGGTGVKGDQIKKAYNAMQIQQELTALEGMKYAIKKNWIKDEGTKEALTRAINKYYFTINSDVGKSTEAIAEAKEALYGVIHRGVNPGGGLLQGEQTIPPELISWIQGLDAEATAIATQFNSTARFAPIGTMDERMAKLDAYYNDRKSATAGEDGTIPEYTGAYAFDVGAVNSNIQAQMAADDEEDVDITAALNQSTAPAASVPAAQGGYTGLLNPNAGSFMPPPGAAPQQGLVAPVEEAPVAEPAPQVVPPAPVPAEAEAVDLSVPPSDPVGKEIYGIAKNILEFAEMGAFNDPSGQLDINKQNGAMLNLIEKAIADGIIKDMDEATIGKKVAEIMDALSNKSRAGAQ